MENLYLQVSNSLNQKHRRHNKYSKINESQLTKQQSIQGKSNENGFSFLNVIKFSLPIKKGNQSSFSQPKKQLDSEQFQNSSAKAISENEYGKKFTIIQAKARSEKNTIDTPYNTETDDNISTFDEFKGKEKRQIVGKQSSLEVKKTLSENKNKNLESKQEKIQQKLNLGLKKKKGEKGKIKQFMQNILARTKIDEVVTIKKSAFQIDQPSPTKNRGTHIDGHEQGTVFSGRRLSRLNSQARMKRGIQAGGKQKESGMKLPNIHQNKKILAMVKNQEKKKRKCNPVQQEEMREGKGESLIKQIYKETIPEQIQYTSICKQSPTKKDEVIQEDFIINPQ